MSVTPSAHTLRYRADSRRVVAVGMSAGAALAAVLGMHYPRYVRAVVAHSGIACGAATSAITAGDVMLRGPQTDVETIGAQAGAGAVPATTTERDSPEAVCLGPL